MRMDFSVGMGRNLRIDEIAEHARVAEESGFSHLALVDQPNLSRDVYVMATIAVLSTSRIRIGQGVTDPSTYRPWVIANATATLDELSGGRAFLGIGAGGAWGKVMKARPLHELREAVKFIRQYLVGGEAEFQGLEMHSEWSRSRVPVYMACNWPKSCQLAGEIADSKEVAQYETASYAATLTYGTYNAIFRRKSEEVNDLRQRLEAVHSGLIDEIRGVHKAFDPYQHELTEATHARRVTPWLIDFFLVTGTAEDIIEQIHMLGQVGVNNISTVLFTIYGVLSHVVSMACWALVLRPTAGFSCKTVMGNTRRLDSKSCLDTK